MGFDFPGIILTADHALEACGKSVSNTVSTIYYPPTACQGEVLDILRFKAQEQENILFGKLDLFDLGAESRIESALLASLACAIGVPIFDGDDLGEFVLGATSVLNIPRAYVVATGTDIGTEGISKIVAACEALASFSKDTRGPLSFIVLAPGAFLTGTSTSFDVWKPWIPHPIPPDLEKRRSSLDFTAFQTYISLRIYWESAGYLGHMENLRGIYDEAPWLISRTDPDDWLDQYFDRHVTPFINQTNEYLNFFEKRIPKAVALEVLDSGIFPSRPEYFAEAIASGLAWVPPGGLRVLVTPVAARVLGVDGRFRDRWQIDDSGASNFLRITRRNQFVASWVMSLTNLIEMEILNVCRASLMTPDIIRELELERELEASMSRAKDMGVYHCSTELVNYATFGNLQKILFHQKFDRSFPVSREQINRTRIVRNQVAHLHPVRWFEVRKILSVLSDLQVSL